MRSTSARESGWTSSRFGGGFRPARVAGFVSITSHETAA
jgi:hypothetical protein